MCARFTRIDLAQNFVWTLLPLSNSNGRRFSVKRQKLDRLLVVGYFNRRGGPRDGSRSAGCRFRRRLRRFLLRLGNGRGSGGSSPRLPASCQRMRARSDGGDVDLRSFAGLEVLDHLRQRGHGIAQQFENGRRSRQRVVDDAIQQVLDGPGELAEITSAHHSPAALQRVERAAHGNQGLPVHGILVPGREAT